jgi:DNA-binding response OmpR family regulator
VDEREPGDDHSGTARVGAGADDVARAPLGYAELLARVRALLDPNFNLISDEARAVMGDAMPTTCLIQERVDPVMRRYLQSLDVTVVELFSWNELPRFLHAINAESDPAA